ncbi:glycosyltransferase [Phycicoccus sonneratiae]|uniref:Glycosyltransferase subfamily 4-like N-terminal domain-containing protein n=1 Tax=Phycicoccus sonneratiae TaxID=2807628 RepID=A0ABS2CMQ6_9MICO|nr:glycosyltransferase [Phycicoccus sonneraticus]MBM6401108.1 hypothetical protein [Phycicoccus sonneraticus]
MEYPRVLHVGFNRIGSPTNTGLTLGSMFAAWPRENLFELYTHSRQTRSASGQNLALAPMSTAPVDGLIRTVLGDRMPKPATDGLNPSVRRSGVTPLRTRVRIGMTALNDIGPVWTGGRWLEEIERFRPQVIHSLLGGVRITRFVTALSRRLDVPVVPHFMDDWMDNLFTDGQVFGLARREAERSVRLMLRQAPEILTVGADMRDHYTRTLQRPAEVVGNSADFDLFDRLIAERRPTSDGPLALRYVGGLHLGRADVLRTVGRALDDHRGEGRRWQLTLNVPTHDLGAAQVLAREVGSITSEGSLDHDAVPQAIVNSDALLFLESSDPGIVSFTRLSVSTKVPEYLASGRPVMAIGPRNQASIRTLVRTGVAVHGGDGTSGPSIVDSLGELTRFLEEAPSRDGSERRAFREEFGVQETQERLRRALLKASTS